MNYSSVSDAKEGETRAPTRQTGGSVTPTPSPEKGTGESKEKSYSIRKTVRDDFSPLSQNG
jgi:hypothetical protein